MGSIRCIVLIFFILSAFSVSYAKSKPTLVFCVDNWEGLTNIDGTGSYNDVVKKVFSDDYNVRIKIFPWARAQNEFREKKCDSLIAENKVDSIFIKPKIRLDALELQAYFLKGRLKYNGLESLKKHELAWIRGYNYHKILNFPVSFSEFTTVQSGFKMLSAGRFEIMLDYKYAFKDECKLSGVDCARIDGEPSGIIEKTYVIFHQSPRGNILAKIWDERMADLIRAGTIQKIFEQYGQVYTVENP